MRTIRERYIFINMTIYYKVTFNYLWIGKKKEIFLIIYIFTYFLYFRYDRFYHFSSFYRDRIYFIYIII